MNLFYALFYVFISTPPFFRVYIKMKISPLITSIEKITNFANNCLSKNYTAFVFNYLLILQSQNFAFNLRRNIASVLDIRTQVSPLINGEILPLY